MSGKTRSPEKPAGGQKCKIDVLGILLIRDLRNDTAYVFIHYLRDVGRNFVCGENKNVSRGSALAGWAGQA